MAKDLKQKILQSAKELFYENGYEKTTISKIAKSCNTSNGVVSHHYRTKSVLASELDGSFALMRKELVQEKYVTKFGYYHLPYATAIEMRLNFHIYQNDLHARRFFTEFYRLSDKNKTDIEYTNQFGFLEMLCDEMRIPIDQPEDELSLITYSMMGSINQILTAYFDGNIDCSADYACNYYICNFFRALKVDVDLIREIQQVSAEQYAKLDFQIKPYFTIE